MSLLSFFRPTTRARLLAGEHVHWVENHARPSYARRCVLSFPPWVAKADIRQLVEQCRVMNCKRRGLKYELDHIVPVGGELVSGLSVPWNFQIITKKKNKVKGNRLTHRRGCGTLDTWTIEGCNHE
jgi:5-methylcytosine-specific restriction endonuclease McrA